MASQPTIGIILHFGGWQTCEEILFAYTTTCSLPGQDRALLPFIAAYDLVCEGIWAMQGLQRAGVSPIEQAAHWHNLKFLLPSLEALTRDLLSDPIRSHSVTPTNANSAAR